MFILLVVVGGFAEPRGHPPQIHRRRTLTAELITATGSSVIPGSAKIAGFELMVRNGSTAAKVPRLHLD